MDDRDIDRYNDASTSLDSSNLESPIKSNERTAPAVQVKKPSKFQLKVPVRATLSPEMSEKLEKMMEKSSNKSKIVVSDDENISSSLTNNMDAPSTSRIKSQKTAMSPSKASTKVNNLLLEYMENRKNTSFDSLEKSTTKTGVSSNFKDPGIDQSSLKILYIIYPSRLLFICFIFSRIYFVQFER